MCRMRIRVPEQWWGDYLAALGAVADRRARAAGARRRGRLGRARALRRGLVRLQRAADGRGDPPAAQRRRSRSRLGPRPVPGRARRHPDQGRRSRSTPSRRRITVDLRDNPDCQPCGLNLTEACAAQRRDGRRLQRPHRPHACRPTPAASGGSRSGCARTACVGIPRHPFSCSVATTNLADRVSNPVQRAIAELADGFGMAETGPIIPPGVRRHLGPRPAPPRRAASSTRCSSA